MNYYLDLFTVETWDEFKAAGGDITGFRESHWPRLEKLQSGDRLLCYLVKAKRWIAVLEVTGPPVFTSQPKIWVKDDFPSRVPVRIVSELTPETAVSATDLIDRQPMFDSLADRKRWGLYFLGSLTGWDEVNAGIVVRAIGDAIANPVERPLSRAARAAAAVVDTDLGTVTLPEDDDDPSDEAEVGQPADPSEHTELQGLLVRLGDMMGYRVFVARNDRSRVYRGTPLAEMPGVVEHLPVQFSTPINKVLALIDVIWLDANAFAAAFEVEKSTSIYSGLLRMSDLLAMSPNLDIPIYLVAPDTRRDKVVEQVNRPTFRLTKKPLVDVCRFISFDSVRSAFDTHGALLRHLRTSWVHDELSESCHVET